MGPPVPLCLLLPERKPLPETLVRSASVTPRSLHKRITITHWSEHSKYPLKAGKILKSILAVPISRRPTAAHSPSRASTGWEEEDPVKLRARPAAGASTGWEQEDLLKHRARPAERASTGLLQDKPLKHRARPAARASTEWEQEDPLNHRARPVPRTRTLLLRAVLKQTALATQATRAMPACVARHVQRAWPASTRRQQDQHSVAIVERVSTQWKWVQQWILNALHALQIWARLPGAVLL